MFCVRHGLAAAVLMFSIALAATVDAESLSVKMLPGEKWWGLCNNFGREMPFTEKSDFMCDLRKDNYHNQCASFLVSDPQGGRRAQSRRGVPLRIEDLVPADRRGAGAALLLFAAVQHLDRAHIPSEREGHPRVREVDGRPRTSARHLHDRRHLAAWIR